MKYVLSKLCSLLFKDIRGTGDVCQTSLLFGYIAMRSGILAHTCRGLLLLCWCVLPGNCSVISALCSTGSGGRLLRYGSYPLWRFVNMLWTFDDDVTRTQRPSVRTLATHSTIEFLLGSHLTIWLSTWLRSYPYQSNESKWFGSVCRNVPHSISTQW